jgi:diguanylate cyclase (GGDEF)-like protein
MADELSGAPLALALIDSLEVPVVACDGRGRLSLANAAAREMWGLPGRFSARSRADGVTWFAEDPERPGTGDLLNRALAGEQPLQEWRQLPSAAGDIGSVLVSAKPLYDTEGALQGAVMRVMAAEDNPVDERQLQNYASDLEMLMEASRMLSEVSDPDEAAATICTVATGATGAMAMLLWELNDEQLVLCHYETGFATFDLSDLTEHAFPGAARSLAESSTTIERLTAIEDGGEAGADMSSLTAWHQPLICGGRQVGVLTILWAGVLTDVDRPAALISSLAQHAATALDRAGLLRRLGRAAATDALTGLANRRVWQERLDHEIARAQREKLPLSLILIDIDHFKRYNDRYGHPEGDRLLHDVAGAWSQGLRKTDLLARIGGEEFAVILPACPTEHVLRIADTLRAAMPSEQTCSLGVVTSYGHASASELYAAADEALYRAKHAGRDRANVGVLVEPRGIVAA